MAGLFAVSLTDSPESLTDFNTVSLTDTLGSLTDLLYREAILRITE